MDQLPTLRIIKKEPEVVIRTLADFNALLEQEYQDAFTKGRMYWEDTPNRLARMLAEAEQSWKELSDKLNKEKEVKMQTYKERYDFLVKKTVEWHNNANINTTPLIINLGKTIDNDGYKAISETREQKLANECFVHELREKGYHAELKNKHEYEPADYSWGSYHPDYITELLVVISK